MNQEAMSDELPGAVTDPEPSAAAEYVSTSTIDSPPREPKEEAAKNREAQQLELMADKAIEDANGSDLEFEVILNMKQDGKLWICKPTEQPRNRILECMVLALRTLRFKSALEGIAGEQIQPRCFESAAYPIPVSITELRRENDVLRMENDEIASTNMILKRKLEECVASIKEVIDGGAAGRKDCLQHVLGQLSAALLVKEVEPLQEAVAEVCEAIADNPPQTDEEAAAAAMAEMDKEAMAAAQLAEECF